MRLPIDRLFACVGRGAPSDTATRVVTALLVATALAWLALRFVGLERAPYGVWMDESRVAMHTVCLAQRGRDADGRPWPLFSDAFGGGHHPITLLAFDVAWTRVFGHSIAAFRSASGVFTVVTIAALFAFVSAFVNRCAALFAVLAALLSPWAFHFSRVAWEAPCAVMFLVCGLAALTRARRPPVAVAAGLCFAAAMYTYPPLRVTTPLVAMTATGILVHRRTISLGASGIVWGALTAAASPLVWLTLNGAINSRTMDVAIFNPDWLDEHRGNASRAWFFVRTFLANLVAHADPRFLFVTGDPNERHGPPPYGQLGLLDALAALLLVAAVVRRLLLRPSPTSPPTAPAFAGSEAAFAFAWGTFGVVPAALTWDSLPHALRSLASWPAAAMLTGIALSWAVRRGRVWLAAIALATIVHTGAYLPAYFAGFGRLDPEFFRSDVMAALDSQPTAATADTLRKFLDRYVPLEFQYYFVFRDGKGCRGSARALHRLEEGH